MNPIPQHGTLDSTRNTIIEIIERGRLEASLQRPAGDVPVTRGTCER
jgi:hypothetical protein